MKRSGAKWIIVIGIAVILALLLLLDWLILDLSFLGEESFSLWQAGKLLTSLQDFGGDDLSDLSWYVYILYFGLAFVYIGLLWTTCAAFSSHAKGKAAYSNFGFVASLILAAAVIVYTLQMNHAVSEETNGLFSSVLEVTLMPYLTIVLSITGIVLVSGMNRRRQIASDGFASAARYMPTNTQSGGNAETAAPLSDAATGGFLKDAEGGQRFQITNYCPESMLRVFAAVLRTETHPPAIAIQLADYGRDISALRVDMELISVFGDSLEIRDVGFVELSREREGRIFKSEFYPLDISEGKLREIRQIRIYPKLTVTEDGIETTPQEFRDSAVPEKELHALRARYGADAMERPSVTDSGWLCACGVENAAGCDACRMCSRRRAGAQEDQKRFCPSCGLELPQKAKFCSRCGRRLDGNADV